MKQAKTVAIAKQRETIVVIMAATLCSLVALYLYFLSASIIHVVMRQEMTRTIKDMQSEVATLESEYMHAQHQLSANVASLDGYEEATDKIFLSRIPSTLVLNQP